MNPASAKTPVLKAGHVFVLLAVVAAATALVAYFTGRPLHRTVYLNSLIATSACSLLFFCRTAIALYRGSRLADNAFFRTPPRLRFRLLDVSALPDVGDAVGGDSLIASILSMLAMLLLVFLLGTVILLLFELLGLLLFWISAALYSGLYLMIKLALRNRRRCRGELLWSLAYTFAFTGLYSLPVYATIFVLHFLLLQ